jgi:hypothetical protein
MSEENNLPDWLKQLRDQQLGTTETSPAEPAAFGEPAPPAPPSFEEPAPAAEADSGLSGLEALREKASVEPVVEEKPSREIPIISQLDPFQRFVLALMLFLNVSVLGCLFLMVLGKISLVR